MTTTSERTVGRGGLTQGRALWIVDLWLAAGLLILGQYLWVQELFEAARAWSRTGEGELLLPSQQWHFWGIVIPLGLVTAAIILQFRWSRDAWRELAGVALLLMIPINFIGLIVAGSGAHQIDSARLRDGHRFILAIEPIMTDSVYTLYEPAGPLGLYWRRSSTLDYSEDGRFIGKEALMLAPDENWLLVTRAGLWTDCFRLSAGRPIGCLVLTHPSWTETTYERDMRRRSMEIASLTGMQPPPIR